MLEATYVEMEIALTRDGEIPDFLKVTKRLRGANGIPKDSQHEYPMLDTRVYDV